MMDTGENAMCRWQTPRRTARRHLNPPAHPAPPQAPLCEGVDDRHWNALNLVFRLIYPPCATFLALLFVRFFPAMYLPNLAVVHGLNRPPTRVGAWHSTAQDSARSVVWH